MLNDITTRGIELALNGLALRQQVIADNIANVDTPGFKAGEVLFEERLRQVLASGSIGPEARPVVIRREGTSLRTDGNNVDLEREMALLADTGLRFSALAQIAAARFSLMRSIITEGRR